MQVGVWIPNCQHLAIPENIRGAAAREHLVLEFLVADGRELDG